MSTETQAAAPETLAQAEQAQAEQISEHKTLRVIGWFSAGMAVATLGIYLGYEIRSRYKFSHRTPYDFYSRAEPSAANDFGVGI
jgi:type VI protein secretion system component VasF